jgi:cobaltochelatase CobS
MYQLLSTNIETVKANGETAKEREISVVVKTSDLEKGVKEPKLYAFRYGMIYDPTDEFSPNIKGNQKIKDYHIESYYQQKPAALKEYARLLSVFENGQGKGGQDSKELELLKLDLKAKEIRIREQADRIAELQKQGQAPSGQTEQLKAMIDTMAKLQANRIEIVTNGRTTKVMEKIVHENFATIVKLVGEKKRAVYMYGPAGTGKSQLAADVAEALGLEFYPASTLTQEYKLSGFEDAGGKYHETNFFRAFTKGGLFFLDEMDSSSSDVLVGINGALANGYYDFPTGTEYAHKDFRVIAAGNTIGRGGNEMYTGRQALDLSTLDRFLGVELDYSPRIDEAVALGDKELIEFAQAVRKAAKESGIMVLMSYRSISQIADLKEDFELVQVLKMAFIKGVASDDIRMLARNMAIDNNNQYYKALRKAA